MICVLYSFTYILLVMNFVEKIFDQRGSGRVLPRGAWKVSGSELFPHETKKEEEEEEEKNTF